MSASEQQGKRADAVAVEAISRTWPMASPETINRLVRLSSVVEGTSGTLMAEGERPSRVALVLSGTVVSTWSAPDGRVVYVGLFGPGQLIGLTTLTGASIVSGIEAVTTVTMLVWPSREFRAVTDTDLAVSSNCSIAASTPSGWSIISSSDGRSRPRRVASRGCCCSTRTSSSREMRRSWRGGSCRPWRVSRRRW
jgi:hypothetical protein